MNYKETLRKLHEAFPEFDIETILKIMDCYTESTSITAPYPWNGSREAQPLTISTKPWENIIYCSDTDQAGITVSQYRVK